MPNQNAFKMPLVSKRLRLSPLRNSDIPSFESFFSDRERMYYYLPSALRFYTGEQLGKFLSDWTNGTTNYAFGIHLSEGRCIGILNLDDVDWDSGRAEVGIAITDAASEGKGYAAEALNLLIDHCFIDLGWHRLSARFIQGNHRSQKLFTSLGFQSEGIQREFQLRDGEYLDMNLLGLLRSDYLNATEITK